MWLTKKRVKVHLSKKNYVKLVIICRFGAGLTTWISHSSVTVGILMWDPLMLGPLDLSGTCPPESYGPAKKYLHAPAGIWARLGQSRAQGMRCARKSLSKGLFASMACDLSLRGQRGWRPLTRHVSCHQGSRRIGDIFPNTDNILS